MDEYLERNYLALRDERGGWEVLIEQATRDGDDSYVRLLNGLSERFPDAPVAVHVRSGRQSRPRGES